MTDERRDLEKRSFPGGPVAGSRPGGARTLQDLPRRRPRRRQDLRDAFRRPQPAARGRRRRRRGRRDAWPRRDAGAPRGVRDFRRAVRSTTRATCSTRWTSTRCCVGGRNSPSSTSLRIRMPPAPPSETIPGCRRTARGGDRCLHDAEHPACRQPQRHRCPDHAHPREGNRARLHHRQGRRYRSRSISRRTT